MALSVPCFSLGPRALNMWLGINKRPVPTCEKEMKEEGKAKMTEAHAGKTQKPKATNLSSESRSPQPKHVFMPGSPRELHNRQGGLRVRVTGASWEGAQTLGVRHRACEFQLPEAHCLPNPAWPCQLWRFPGTHRPRVPRLLRAD